jgi:hypothetical protein
MAGPSALQKSQPGVTFNVLDYGGHGDGVTDDSLHIRDAFQAAHDANGGTVFFPAGRTYYVATSWSMPTIRTNDWVGASPTVQRSGTITVSGYGATIKYANATTRFCWLQSLNTTVGASQWSTQGNLVIEGFTIDNNYRQPSADCGTVFWMNAYYNVDNVTIRDVTMLDRVTHRTVYNQSASCCGIFIKTNWTNRTQAHTTYLTNITVDGCTVYGQTKPLAILTDSSGGEAVIGTNPIIVDNILLKDSTFDSCHHFGSNAMLGGHASGGTLTVTDCAFNDSSDDGLEIDAFDSVTISGCTFHANRQSICHTWFSFPKSSGKPTWSIADCHYSGNCNPYWPITTVTEPGDRSPMMPEVRRYNTAAEYDPGDTRSWGNFTISGCTLEFGVTNSYSSHNAAFTIGSNGTPLESVTITDCDITDVGSGGSQIYIKQGTGMGRTLPISIHDVRWRNSTGNSYALLTASQVTLSGSRIVDSDISGLS